MGDRYCSGINSPPFIIIVFLPKSSYMPIDPSTVAGNMYYICDSDILEDFEGLFILSEKGRALKSSKVELNIDLGR
jgi:hypothetical protein